MIGFGGFSKCSDEVTVYFYLFGVFSDSFRFGVGAFEVVWQQVGQVHLEVIVILVHIIQKENQLLTEANINCLAACYHRVNHCCVLY